MYSEAKISCVIIAFVTVTSAEPINKDTAYACFNESFPELPPLPKEENTYPLRSNNGIYQKGWAVAIAKKFDKYIYNWTMEENYPYKTFVSKCKNIRHFVGCVYQGSETTLEEHIETASNSSTVIIPASLALTYTGCEPTRVNKMKTIYDDYATFRKNLIKAYIQCRTDAGDTSPWFYRMMENNCTAHQVLARCAFNNATERFNNEEVLKKVLTLELDLQLITPYPADNRQNCSSVEEYLELVLEDYQDYYKTQPKSTPTTELTTSSMEQIRSHTGVNKARRGRSGIINNFSFININFNYSGGHPKFGENRIRTVWMI